MNVHTMHIIGMSPDHVVYIRDGFRCFMSEHLRSEAHITDGYLLKESATKFRRLRGQYRRVYCALDFQRQLMRFKEEFRDADFLVEKDVAFADVLEASPCEIDIYKGEHEAT